MECPFCKQIIKDGSAFCPKCGSRLPVGNSASTVQKHRYCKKCGKPCPPDQTLCSACQKNEETAYLRNTPPKRKKKSILPLILVLLLLVLLLIAGVIGIGIVSGKTPLNHSDDSTEVVQNHQTEEKPEDSSEAYSNEIGVIGDSIELDTSNSSESEKKTEIDANSDTTDIHKEEHRYEVIAADVSWTDANEAAKKAGGHLATITSTIEYEEVCQKATESGLKYLWMGAFLTSSKMNWGDPGTWITGEKWDFENWYPGEPSKEDTDGTKEYYLCLWNARYNDNDIGWTFNDQRNDIVKDFTECVGKVGYIVEYGDVESQ